MERVVMLDVLITGGTVIDGSGSPGRAMDVGIVDDRIAAVEPLAGAEAARVIAATGLVVTPGFIDIHSHSDFTLLVDPRAVSSITQGVTLEEVGNSEDEVGDLCRVVAAQDGLYSTHTRNRDEGAVAAVEEAIRTAEQSGVRLQISHLTPRSGAAPTERAIDLVDAARSRSVDVAFDMHTRLFGTTHLKALLPPWALDGGVAAVRRRLEDSAARDRKSTR